ncbi:MAG: glycerol kinase GlpK [Dehalococcoidia bacterium]
MQTHILALDQGTTSTRAIVFDGEALPVASAQIELRQHYPQPGWVEHDPVEILNSAVSVCRQAVEKAGLAFSDIAALGITNQRETAIVWERRTGRPMANAIVWQCRRTADMCRELFNKGYSPDIRERTGLVVDAYFSATKLRWLLDVIPDGQRWAEDGELCFGTVDSWLLFRLTGGEVHATDATNACRTMLLNLHDLQWDPALLDLFDVPAEMLPEVRPSAGDFGVTSASVLGGETQVTGIAGDQHAALYGQACFEPGMTKCTYGTGAFVLTNSGSRPPAISEGLLSTLGWQVGAKRSYAQEGSIFVTGAAVQWLRDGLGVIADATETSALADSVEDNGGVYMVPAFVGLGAPHWDPDARGAITGLTRGTTRAHLARAALESTAYQVRDVVDAMDEAARRRRRDHPLRVDGGQTANRFLMQFQADILGRPVEVAAVGETTALGAAYLAGRGAGMWRSESEVAALWQPSERYEPQMAESKSRSLYTGWLDAVRRARSVP